jgi:hypothetical protein
VKGTVVGTLLCLTCGAACNTAPSRVSVQPPIAGVEAYGDHAVVELVKGASVRSIVGADLFGDLNPRWTDVEAEARLGKPKEIVKRDNYLTLFVYERQGRRVAVARQTVVPSDGGPLGTSYHLEAFPPEGFVDSLPRSLRQLIQAKGELREIGFRSSDPNDWNIHLHVRDGRVSHVTAHERAPAGPDGEGRGSPGVPATR